MTCTEKKLPPLGVGDEVKYFDDGTDGHPVKWVNGVVTEAGEDGVAVQWEDLEWPTEYEFSKIEIIGNQIFGAGRKKDNEEKVHLLDDDTFGSFASGGYND